MTDEQNDSIMEDDKDPSHSNLRKHNKKGRKPKHENSIEQSAAPETKSDTEDNVKTKTKKVREQDARKGKKKGDKHKDIGSSLADEPTLSEDPRSKHPDEPKNMEKKLSQSLTVDQLIEKYQGKHEKQKKYQLAGFNYIKTLTKMMHMQQKNLGLKLQDITSERKVDVNNQPQMQRYLQNGYVLVKQDLMMKNIPSIELEQKALSETYDQMFEKVKFQHKPYDFYEQQYLISQGKTIPEPQQLTFKDHIKQSEEKLQKLNREYE